MDLARAFIQRGGAASLSNQAVADELQLSGSQRKRIQQMTRESSRRIRAHVDEWLSAGERRGSVREALRQLAHETDNRLLEVLTVSQRNHFEQLRSGNNSSTAG